MKTRAFFSFVALLALAAAIDAAIHRDWTGTLLCTAFAAMVPTLYRIATDRRLP